MQTKTLPKFKGTPLIPEELRNLFPKVGILGGDFGIEILDRYIAKVKEKFDDNKYLKVFSYDGKQNVVTGSNAPGNVLLDEILEQYGCHIATQANLETILRVNLFDLTKTYEDTGLVLRSEENPNEYLAKDLSKQLKEKQYPVLIHLKDLTLRKDDESPLRVSFNIKENADLIYDEILNNSDRKFSSEDIDPKIGLPSKLEGGNRHFYTRDSGLSRLYLFNGLDSNADDSDLAVSNVNGRVVVVSTEGEQKISSVLEKYKSQFDGLKQKYNDDLRILREQIDSELNQ